MEKRVWSKKSWNGYRLVHWSGIGDPSIIGWFKRLDEKDECGYLADEDDIPKCPEPGLRKSMLFPQSTYLYVKSCCQNCQWLVKLPDGDFHCALVTISQKGKLLRGTVE